MGRPPLTARRHAQTRHDISSSALDLFVRDGYDNVSVELIAEEAGISLRTFYRYFSTKDEVLAPVITDGIEKLAQQIALRPPSENLATAVQLAFEEISPAAASRRHQAIVHQLVTVPALRARWLNDLRTIEETLVPVVRQRAGRPPSDEQARLSAAAIVTCLRVAFELSAELASTEPLTVTLGNALRYLRNGANL
jgi:AcrR family transcriptional regulator